MEILARHPLAEARGSVLVWVLMWLKVNLTVEGVWRWRSALVVVLGLGLR